MDVVLMAISSLWLWRDLLQCELIPFLELGICKLVIIHVEQIKN
jgi:hypothetical protein